MSPYTVAAATATLDASLSRDAGYTALVDAHAGGVFRLMFGMVGDRATAEDLTQDAFLRAYERWQQLRSPEGARGWLFAIAVNLARQQLRRGRRWSWLPLDSVDWMDHGRHDRSGDPAADAISRILRQLKPEDREVLLLMGLQDLTAAETAEVLGIQPSAVHKRWQRACARFRAIAALEEVSHAM